MSDAAFYFAVALIAATVAGLFLFGGLTLEARGVVLVVAIFALMVVAIYGW